MSKRILTVSIGQGTLGLIHTVSVPVDEKGQRNFSKVMLQDGTVLDLNIHIEPERIQP